MTRIWLVLVAPLLFATAIAVDSSAGQQTDDKVNTLRKEIVTGISSAEDKSEAVAKAYKTLFTHLGLDGVKKLINDEDTSIALQAAWETHKTIVKRNPAVPIRTNWVFDKKPMEEFLAVVAKRLKAEPPEWWRATLLVGDVFPGMHHAFIDLGGELPVPPKLEVQKDEVIITSGKQVTRLPRAVYDKAASFADIGTAPEALWGADQSFFARPFFRGYPFQAVGVDTKTGKKLWMALVWAARRGFSTGPAGVCPVEIRRHGDTVIVYGCESHGMYAEGFDAKTGKCQFRFCTCYWFNFSERWGLK